MKIAGLCLAIGLAVCALAAPVTAFAQNRRPSINRIEHRQQARIRQGVRSGELTRAEAARLRSEQARIRQQERINRADGRGLNLQERRRLNQEQRQAGRHIYRQTHDQQDR